MTNQNRVLNMRLSELDQKKIEWSSKRMGVNKSEFVREAIREKAEREREKWEREQSRTQPW